MGSRRYAVWMGVGVSAVVLCASSAASFAEMVWSYPQVLNSDGATDGNRNDYFPSLATDGAGFWVAVWAGRDLGGGPLGDDMDIFVAHSTDDGMTWSPPEPIDPAAWTDDLYDSAPVVCTDGTGHWMAVWEMWDQQATSDIDLLYVTSTNGIDWSPAAFFNSDHATDITRDHDNDPDIATDANGNWVAVWYKRIDSPPGDEGDIYVSHSTDHGVTWSELALLHPDMASDLADDIVPRVATDGAGAWVTIWQSDGMIGTNAVADGDIHFARSTDNGLTWTTPTALNTDYVTDGLYDIEGEIVTDGAGVWIAAWYREGVGGGVDRDILFARSLDAGLTWSFPTPLNTNWATDSGDDGRPRLVADGAGQWVVAWYSKEALVPSVGTDRDLFFAHSCDDGTHWTAPAVLNGNAYSDLSASDYSHELYLGTGGSVVAAWYTDDSLGGTVGYDRDILFSRSSVLVCGDGDNDADFDLADFAVFQECFAPIGPLDPACEAYDFDADGGVDLIDYDMFADLLDGPRS